MPRKATLSWHGSGTGCRSLHDRGCRALENRVPDNIRRPLTGCPLALLRGEPQDDTRAAAGVCYRARQEALGKVLLGGTAVPLIHALNLVADLPHDLRSNLLAGIKVTQLPYRATNTPETMGLVVVRGKHPTTIHKHMGPRRTCSSFSRCTPSTAA